MDDPCIYCAHDRAVHEPEGECPCGCQQWRDEPTDNELANGPGIEGGIGYRIRAANV